MEKNNPRKYIQYAIGEIILVVIGILIALQINNWNERRKSRLFELEMLAQIQDNLAKDKLALNIISINFKRAIDSSDKILDNSLVDQYPDSLEFWLGHVVQFERFSPITNSYEALKARGLDQFPNKELRLLIGSYYDDEINRVINSVEDLENTFKTDWLPIMYDIVVDFKFQHHVVVSDPSIFMRPSAPRNVIIMNRDNYSGGLNRIMRIIQLIERIEVILDEELKK